MGVRHFIAKIQTPHAVVLVMFHDVCVHVNLAKASILQGHTDVPRVWPIQSNFHFPTKWSSGATTSKSDSGCHMGLGTASWTSEAKMFPGNFRKCVWTYRTTFNEGNFRTPKLYRIAKLLWAPIYICLCTPPKFFISIPMLDHRYASEGWYTFSAPITECCMIWMKRPDTSLSQQSHTTIWS